MSFLIDDLRTLWRMRGLLAVLTRREISGRFAGSAGGMLWAWVQPVLNIAAYFLVFDVVFAMRMGDNAPADRVGTFLIVGMLAASYRRTPCRRCCSLRARCWPVRWFTPL